MICTKKLLAAFFWPNTAFYLSDPPDKMPKVNAKTEAVPQKFLVKYLSRSNSFDFKLYTKKIQLLSSQIFLKAKCFYLCHFFHF